MVCSIIITHFQSLHLRTFSHCCILECISNRCRSFFLRFADQQDLARCFDTRNKMDAIFMVAKFAHRHQIFGRTWIMADMACWNEIIIGQIMNNMAFFTAWSDNMSDHLLTDNNKITEQMADAYNNNGRTWIMDRQIAWTMDRQWTDWAIVMYEY